jgi:beta-galactosidase
VDNGNAATIEPFQARQRRAFNGLALLIVRSKAGPGGKIQVTAAADGLEPGKTEITAGR